ncbi:hypothetical protein MTBGP_21990 [Moorella thermoacetica]
MALTMIFTQDTFKTGIFDVYLEQIPGVGDWDDVLEKFGME